MSADLRSRLAEARLYFICDCEPGGRPLAGVLAAALRGGVDVFQLRDKGCDDAELLAAAVTARELCSATGALFIVNDRPDLAVAAHADGVHVGQDDLPVAQARECMAPGMLVGQSTHTPPQVDDGAQADYIGVGPVYATPTKADRLAVGVALVRYAANSARVPFFAIGGIDATTVAGVAGARGGRIAAVRAISEATDPEAAARELRTAVEHVPLGRKRERARGPA